VNVSTAHRIRLQHLDRERPVQPGDSVVVDLGHATDVTGQQAWRIRSLVAGAASVQLRGSTGPVRDWVASVLVDNPDVTT